MPVEIRPFAWTDVEGIARVHRAAEPVDRAGRICDAIALAQRFRQPGVRTEEECLVAVAGGALVGYGLCLRVGESDQYMADGVVHPAWRRRGVGRALLERMLAGARQAGASCLDLRAREDESAALGLARALGFERVRVWERMWLEPLRVPAFGFPAGYGWRNLRPQRDQAAYVELVNETLADHWGVGPITVERVAFQVSQPSFRPGDIIFATHQGEIVGVSAARMLERRIGSRLLSVAHLGPVGVRAGHRGLGLGHALVAATLRHARRRQIQAAELDVDETNAVAIHVYEDCGFERQFRILWYRRHLR